MPQQGNANKSRERVQSFVSLEMQALSHVSPFDILSASELDAIRRVNPHPYLETFSICHEGLSRPVRLIGKGAQPIRWFREAVQSLGKTLVKGVKFFRGHNADSSTDGREVLGEVVGSKEMEIDGKLHHVVVGYFPDREKVRGFDICSQEGEWLFSTGPGGLIAEAIDKLTGIALASSQDDEPGFPGALRLGAVQAFTTDDTTDSGSAGEPARRSFMAELHEASFQELLSELVRRNVFPSQVFTKDQLKTDRNFAPDFEKADGFDKLQEQVTSLTEKLTAATSEVEQLKAMGKETETLKRQVAVTQANSRLAELMKEANLTAAQATYAAKHFSDKVSDLTDEGLKTFIGEQLALYQDAHTGETQTAGKGGDQGADSQGAGKDVDPKDFSKKVNNPLLSEDMKL